MNEKRRGKAEAKRPPLTISRQELLVDGSDAEFRELIHDLLSYANHLETCRDGFATLAGLTGVQYEIVMAVHRLQRAIGISVGQVAARLHRSGAFITIETGKLAEKCILEKRQDPADARRVLLALTRDGERVIETLAPYQRQVNDALFACLDQRRFRALKALARDLVGCGDRAVNLVEYIVREPLPTPRKGSAERKQKELC